MSDAAAELTSYRRPYVLASAWASVLGLSMSPVLTRLLEPGELGGASLLLSTSTLTATVAAQGLVQSISRFGPEAIGGPEVVMHGLRSLPRVALTAAGIAIALALFLSRSALDSQPHFVYLLVGVAAASVAAFAVLQSCLAAREQALRFAVSRVVDATARFAFTLGAAVAGAGSAAMIGGVAFAGFLTVPVGLHVASREAKKARAASVSPEVRKRLTDYGRPMVLWFVLLAAMDFCERAMIGALSGLDTLGLYSVAFALAHGGVVTLTTPLMLAVSPRIFRAASGHGPELAETLIVRGVQDVARIALCGVAMALIASLIGLSRLLGPGYANVPVLSAGIVVSVASWQALMYLHKPIESEAQSHLLVKAMLAAITARVLAGFVLIERFQVGGAVVSSLIAAVVYLAMTSRHPGSRAAISKALKVLVPALWLGAVACVLAAAAAYSAVAGVRTGGIALSVVVLVANARALRARAGQ